MTLYTDGSWLQQVRQRLVRFPLYRFEALFILPLSIATLACSAPSHAWSRCDARRVRCVAGWPRWVVPHCRAT